MKNQSKSSFTKSIIFTFTLFIFSSLQVYTQTEPSCKVLMPEISGTYKGGCKDGLADGKGSAKGQDSYSGYFKNGLPDGTGKYTYENGNVFSGSWSNGVKDGPGEFIYFLNGTKYFQKGFWKNGDYVGKTDPDLNYRIKSISGIEDCTINKLELNDEKIKLSFVNMGVKFSPHNLRVTSTTGQVNQEGKTLIVFNYNYPVICDVQFTIPSSGGDKTCILSFEILKPGNYDVIVTTN